MNDNLLSRLDDNGLHGSENNLHRVRRWTIERKEAAARIRELESIVETVERDTLERAASEVTKAMAMQDAGYHIDLSVLHKVINDITVKET